LKQLPEWKRSHDSLVRTQTFPTYKNALDFVYQLGLAADAQDHHPDIELGYKKVTVRYSTHSAGGITGLDFQMAHVAEDLFNRLARPGTLND
ncbi:MAG: 4a-hydroxytetrahydrobiopterin dehydratase, partial [Elusimicrobia bacterium]|nr:4a-hydroxytetrahydrobiopterin dehydratase [Elusimicrobiota bacterium]